MFKSTWRIRPAARCSALALDSAVTGAYRAFSGISGKLVALDGEYRSSRGKLISGRLSYRRSALEGVQKTRNDRLSSCVNDMEGDGAVATLDDAWKNTDNNGDEVSLRAA
ncbi:hypothetical protein OH77DRAFT_967763 [Trametes cingulata]|nr:hypothetical protein OH77DRAFT_967763 [Trametes cingulata]